MDVGDAPSGAAGGGDSVGEAAVYVPRGGREVAALTVVEDCAGDGEGAGGVMGVEVTTVFGATTEEAAVGAAVEDGDCFGDPVTVYVVGEAAGVAVGVAARRVGERPRCGGDGERTEPGGLRCCEDTVGRAAQDMHV